jgi:hypothetical protein
MRRLLRDGNNRLFAWELFSHKWLRYGAFLFLACCYLCNAALRGDGEFYYLLFIFQNIFYLTVLAALLLQKLGYASGILYIPYYFTLVNLASAHAAVKFILGKKHILWTPRKG